MEVTMKIEGMMCGHCEMTVKKALEAIPTVAEAIVSRRQAQRRNRFRYAEKGSRGQGLQGALTD